MNFFANTTFCWQKAWMVPICFENKDNFTVFGILLLYLTFMLKII